MSIVRKAVPFLGLIALSNMCFAAEPDCADEARLQAKRLLTFHVGEDDRIAIDPTVTQRIPLRNPANRKQKFTVLEVWGHVYKGSYRMRLIYAEPARGCTLMGQEILEHASL
ncbi:hypothetical protein [Luteimonas aquatica]|uniref:hypothetical protein n=1 Tax=Luteimonas aquatica TaxID=450364 RepID=UPI001F565B21|nr:hypothetical protein [Luteimonas aquatica]